MQLADLWIDAGEPATAVAVCQAGLRIDRYCDPLWRSLLRALQLDHDHAGHALAAAQYDAVLADLGVQATPTLHVSERRPRASERASARRADGSPVRRPPAAGRVRLRSKMVRR